MPTQGANATLAPAHRAATVDPGAQGYDSTPGRSRTLPAANPQTFAHVAVTFRPQLICTGITESREISWLGQAWLSATQFSPAALKAIYAGLPTPRPDSFWTAFPIAPSFRNTTIPALNGLALHRSQELRLSHCASSLSACWQPQKPLRQIYFCGHQKVRSHSCFSLPNVARVDKILCHRPAGTSQGRLRQLLGQSFTLGLKLMGNGKYMAPSAAFPGWA